MLFGKTFLKPATLRRNKAAFTKLDAKPLETKPACYIAGGKDEREKPSAQVDLKS